MAEKQEVWKRQEPDSPCVQVCVIEPDSGLCMGCYRTRDEIAAWGAMDRPDRLSLMQVLPSRADQIKPKRRGGRRGR
ncbi:MAG: DUF1289 domain-containing protein [Pseudomonadota bacterium]